MTVGTQSNIITYPGDGVATVFPFTFPVLSADHLSVYKEDIAVGVISSVSYTVSGIGDPSGGSVTLSTPIAGTEKLVIIRQVPFTQDLSVLNQGGFYPENVEREFDLQEMQIQQVKEEADRSIRVPIGETLADGPSIAFRKGKIFGWNAINGLLEFISYQSFANTIAPLLNVSFQGVPGPGNDLSTHADSYAVGDGVTDDTVALATGILAAQAATGRFRFGAKTYLFSQLVIPAGVHVETAGVKTVFHQKAGQPIGTVLIKITGGDSGIETFSALGNIATDTSEFQNIIQITCDATTGSMSNIRIGDIFAQDVRGDIVLVSQTAAAYAAGYRLRDVKIGFIRGDNIYRNPVSIVGGSDIDVAGINCTRVGLYSFDIEPDPGCGPGAGYRIGPIKGHWVAAVSQTAADFIDAITFHSLDLDPAYATNSVPPYPAPTRYGALTTRNAKSVTVLGSLRTNGHPGAAYKPVYNVGELSDQSVRIGNIDMKNMCTDVAETAWIWGAGDAIKLTIHHVNVDMGASVNEAVFRGLNFGEIGSVDAKGTGGYRLVYGCADLKIGPVKVAASVGNVLVSSSDRIKVNGGSYSGDYLFSFSNGCETHGMAVTATIGVDLGGTCNWLFGGSAGGTNIGFRFYTGGALLLSADLAGVLNGPSYQVAGNKVLGARGAAVANAAGGATVDVEARAAINALLARFRVTGGHGAIAD